MKIVLSPAKRLAYQNIEIPANKLSKPLFVEQSEQLINILKNKDKDTIKSLMNLSDDLAELNLNRYLSWDKNHNNQNAVAAINLFYGDAYKGLEAKSLPKEALYKLNEKLLILSGLYGLLHPFDLIQEHRLEMGTRLNNPKGSTLYDFWKNLVTDKINEELSKEKNKTLINLASNEYFKVIDKKKLKHPVITPVFKESKNGQYKTIAIFAKKARGLMTKFIVENNIDNHEHLKAFDYDGYTFSNNLSSENQYVFIR